MKTLDTSGKAAVAAKAQASPPKATKKKTDTWLSDDERKAEVNAAADRARGRGGWLNNSRGWLKGR